MTKRQNRIKINKAKHPISDLYICRDCVFVFQIHTKLAKHRPFCPNCGDMISTMSYDADGEIPKRQWDPWTEKELLYIDKIINGELKKYQVAMVIGRTYGAVQRKVERVKNARKEILKSF